MSTDRVILLVEDNKDDEVLTLRALRKNNIANDIAIARDGDEAIKYLSAPTTVLPQLVLLDLNLPKLDGLEVLRRVRANARTRHIPVVILTSSKEDEDVVRGYSLGANAYVRKPVDFNQFTEAVRTVGLFWLVLNEVPAST